MRSLSPADFIRLPPLSASQAISLIHMLQAQAAPPHAPPPSAKPAFDDMVAKGQALIASSPAATPNKGTAAVESHHRVQRHWTALRGWMEGFTQLDDADDPRVGHAKALHAALFGADTSFLTAAIEVEWAESERRMKALTPEQVAIFTELGGAVFWTKLVALHAVEGQQGHITTAQPAAVRANQAEALRSAKLAIKQYVLMVSSSVVAGQSATQKLADTLLQPLTNWPAHGEKHVAPAKAPETPASTPPATPKT